MPTAARCNKHTQQIGIENNDEEKGSQEGCKESSKEDCC